MTRALTFTYTTSSSYGRCLFCKGWCIWTTQLPCIDYRPPPRYTHTTVDGSEILPAPVEVGSLSHFLQGFSTIQKVVGLQISEPSTACGTSYRSPYYCQPTPGAVVAIRYGHPQPHIHKRIARRIMDQVGRRITCYIPVVPRKYLLGAFKYLLMFTPVLGEDESILTI